MRNANPSQKLITVKKRPLSTFMKLTEKVKNTNILIYFDFRHASVN